ncbi:MAG: hypothetical protein ACE5D2_07530 [Fidelibacterota bacterium]
MKNQLSFRAFFNTIKEEFISRGACPTKVIQAGSSLVALQDNNPAALC